MSERASTALMNEMLAGASDRRRDTLMRLKSACDALQSDTRLRLSDIERFIGERFGPEWGPRAQTISNEKSLALGMHHYVEARRREAKRPQSTTLHTDREHKDRNYILNIIEKINNPDARDLMRDVYSRLSVAEAALGRLTYFTRMTRPGIDIDKLAAGEAVVSRELFDNKSVETLRQIRSILINEEKLSSCGLTNNNGIRRKGRLGDELFSAVLLGDFLAICRRLDEE